MGQLKPTGGYSGGDRSGRSGPPAARLAALSSTLDHIRADLTDLEISPSFLVLSDLQPGTATAAAYGRAAADAEHLWLLLQVAADRLEELTQLGEKQLGAQLDDPCPVPDPVSGSLVFPTGPVYQVIDELSRRVSSVLDATSEIEGKWTDVLPRVDAARRTLERLSVDAQNLGVSEPLIGRALALTDDLAERLVSDPGAVHHDDGPNLDAQVAKAARQMAKLRSGRDNLSEDLASTEEVLASLRVLRARAEAAGEETRRKILDPENQVRVVSEQILDGPGGLVNQLTEIFEANGAWTQRRSLLDSWLNATTRLEQQLLAAERANSEPIERRNELRGRLQAYVAKMAGTGRAEDLEVSDLVQQARSLLYHSPTDLVKAEATIAAVAAKLQR